MVAHFPQLHEQRHQLAEFASYNHRHKRITWAACQQQQIRKQRVLFSSSSSVSSPELALEVLAVWSAEKIENLSLTGLAETQRTQAGLYIGADFDSVVEHAQVAEEQLAVPLALECCGPKRKKET